MMSHNTYSYSHVSMKFKNWRVPTFYGDFQQARWSIFQIHLLFFEANLYRFIDDVLLLRNKKARYTWRDHYNCDPYAGSKMVCVSSSRKTCLTTQNAAIFEIHVNYLNSIGGFYLFSPSLTSSVAYHNQHLIFIPLEVGIAVALLTSRWMKITVFNKIPRCNISTCS